MTFSRSKKTSTTFTIKHSLKINLPRETVWDFTQDYARRAEWDPSVLSATVISTIPHRIVRLVMKGSTEMTFVYKQDERPRATSLVASNIVSPIIMNAGGHWTYEDSDGGTLWSVTNTIELKPQLFTRLFAPMLRLIFQRQTIKAMNNARRLIESAEQ